MNTNITAFKKATLEQYNAIKDSLTEENVISPNDSQHEIDMWFDDSNGTIYFYTDADRVSLSGNASRMFARMRNLTDISGLTYFDTSNVTDMNRMFQDCVSLVDLSPIADWDVSNVTDMTFMFGANTSNEMSITDLSPLDNWDVSKVTSFNQTFKNCTSLTSLNGIENWDVSRVTTFNKMLDNNAFLPANKKPIFTVRPGYWDSTGTYIPN